METDKREVTEFDLETGPEVLRLQRMPTDEYNELAKQEKIAASRARFDELLRADRKKPLTRQQEAVEFDRGSPENREEQERERMIEEDPIGRREEYFEAPMAPWGEETGGRRRKTHRKRHSKRKTYKKYRKISRKYKKKTSKRCTKKYRK
jgi:hypothetical protein